MTPGDGSPEASRVPLVGVGLVVGCALGFVAAALFGDGTQLVEYAGVGTAIGLIAGAVLDLRSLGRQPAVPGRAWSQVMLTLALCAGAGTLAGGAIGAALGRMIPGLVVGLLVGIVAGSVLAARRVRGD